MPRANKQQKCSVCQGAKVLPNPNAPSGYAQCPICGGTGIADPNVDPKPRFYNFTPGGAQGTTFALAANAVNIQEQFTVGDYDFWAIYILATSNGVPLSNAAAGLFSVTIIDQSTRNWSDNPILSVLTAGYGERPFPLPAPFKVPGQGIQKAVFNELSGSTNTIQFALFGYEMLPVTAPVPNPGV